jgi:2-iminobutanoate/2-iminopropanoate deaminase
MTSTMTKQVIENADMPKALGPYSQAVAATGELIFIAGQPGIDPVTGEVPSDFAAQARNAFGNLARIVSASGLTMSDVVKTTIYLADPEHFGPLNEIFAEFFPSSPPTRAVPIVKLPKGLLISIEGIAVR